MRVVYVFLSEVYVFFSFCKGRNLDPVCVCLTRNLENILVGDVCFPTV